MTPASLPDPRLDRGPVADAAGVPVSGVGVSGRWRIGRWMAVVAWMAVIFLASSDGFSSSHTGSWLAAALQAFLGDLPPALFATMHATVRKGAHLVEYAILGWLIYRAVSAGEAGPVSWFAILGLSAACAAFDEAHQFLFTASRTGSVVDVMIDVTGATLGAYLAAWRAARSAATTPPYV